MKLRLLYWVEAVVFQLGQQPAAIIRLKGDS